MLSLDEAGGCTWEEGPVVLLLWAQDLRVAPSTKLEDDIGRVSVQATASGEIGPNGVDQALEKERKAVL